jgi:uncharacterized membrane protein YccC
MSFNFLRPGNVNLIFKDRLLDTLIAGAVTFLVAYFILPVWEHTQNIDLMKKSSRSNLDYFRLVIDHFLVKDIKDEEFRLRRKNAIIDLANLSDNFQRMISDPKNQQRKLETVHQFVTYTSYYSLHGFIIPVCKIGASISGDRFRKMEDQDFC